jgi:hypothetical protein
MTVSSSSFTSSSSSSSSSSCNGPGGCRPRMYRSHSGVLYEPDFGSSHFAPPDAPTPTTTRETSSRKRGNGGRETADEFSCQMVISTSFGGFFNVLYSLFERRHAENFFALKNPTASAEFEPANSGTRGQHANP